MKMIIGGQKVDSSDKSTITIVNPATQKVLDTVPAATKEDVNRALDLSKIGFEKWRKTSLLEREKIFNKFMQLLDENYRYFIKVLSEECGKVPARAAFEVSGVKDIFKGYIETAKRNYGKVLVPGTEAGQEKDLTMVVHEPIGTVVALVPFNAPLMLFGYKAAPALAAGNALIVKPPSDNPSAVIRAVELLIEAGVPGEAVQVITGRGSELGNMLIDDPRVDAVTMIGSTAVGKQVAEGLAKRLSPCSLELGGNDPFIVMPDADLDKAAAQAAFTRTGNAGQVCNSPKRFIIHSSVIDEFTEKLLAIVKNIKMGYPDDVDAEIDKFLNGEPTDVPMCPTISERAAKEIERQINLTIEQGATLLYGGKRDGAYVEPTILTNVTRDMDIANDMEIFGPVLPILSFETVEEAIDIANQSCYGLSGCVFTKDWKLGMKVSQRVDSAAMIINSTSLYRNMMQPFGGWKSSGMSQESTITLGEMMIEKTIVLKDFLD